MKAFKKTVACVFALAIFAAAFSGCGAGTSDPGSANEATKSEADAKNEDGVFVRIDRDDPDAEPRQVITDLSSWRYFRQVLARFDPDRQMAVTNQGFFMHCLPVRRTMIVTDDVIEAPTSIVIPEAANREISATVVLKRMLESL